MFVFFGLFYIKHTYPGLFPQYSDSQHIMDMLFQVPIVLFLFALMLSVFADAYRNEREKLKEYSKLLYEKNKELEKLSTTDELTGLYNRRYIFGKLEQLGKEKVNSLIILIDLDNFKQINDKYGHDAGDKVIVKFSEVIKDAIGDQGIVARYGGDEFLIVLDDVQLAEGKQMAEKILKTINELKFNNEVSITVSGGVAFYNGDKGIKEVVKNADQLLYNAKGNGKNDIIIGS
jgi:diguanylate cyclase (GGDEF)-like protein